MAKNVGEIVIQTKVDNRKFEKSINQMEKDIEKASQKIEELDEEKRKLFEEQDINDKSIDEYNKKLEESRRLTERMIELHKKEGNFTAIEEAQKGQERYEYHLKEEEYGPQIKKAEELKNQVEEIENKQEGYRKKILDTNVSLEETKRKLEEGKEKLEEQTKEAQRLKEIENISKGLEKGITKTINNIKRWGLALIGIRGAYSLIHNAMATITKENEQLGANIEYIKWVIAQTIKPIVESIINIAIKAVQIIGVLINMLVGKNIFENLSADKFAESMKNANKNSKGVAGNLKDAKKQLAGFDEMNVLSDTSGGGAGGNDTFAPDFDMSNLGDVEAQVKKFKDDWYEFGDEMSKSLYNMPFSVWTDAFGNWDLAIYGVVQAFDGLWKIITGFFEFFKGIIDIIVGLITGDSKKVKDGIDELIGGLIKIVTGFLEFIQGIMNIIYGVIKGVILTIWDFYVSVISKVAKWLYDNAIKPIGEFFTGLWNGFVSGIKNAIQTAKDWFDGLVNFLRNIVNIIFGFFYGIANNVGEVIAGAVRGAINGVLSVVENTINGFFRMINSAIKLINKIPGVDIGRINMVSFPRLAKGGIVNQPGRGVMVGSAIAGERGQEGVLPLTDSQQMELLGEAIGRYITINANIVNSMNGRIISRELKKIQSEDDFAFNR